MVIKSKGGKLDLKLLPKTPDFEAVLLHIDVMQKQDSTGPYFGQPIVNVVCDGFICMKAIDVQHVEALIYKMGDGLVEGHSQQVRKRRVANLVVRADVGEYLFAVETGMFVSLPRIHGITSALDTALDDGLAKAEVGLSIMGAEFHQDRWTKTADQVAGKWQMAKPIVKSGVEPVRVKRLRRQVDGKHKARIWIAAGAQRRCELQAAPSRIGIRSLLSPEAAGPIDALNLLNDAVGFPEVVNDAIFRTSAMHSATSSRHLTRLIP